MIDEENGKLISGDELLARFIFHRSHLRQDGTIKQDAFIPYPWPDLSVTRHLLLTETELWALGQAIAHLRAKTLHGRADVKANTFLQHQLRVIAAPLIENRNHANVSGWPSEKPAQKIIAQQLAASAGTAHMAG